MGFKLVRVDAQELVKIPLYAGEHIIGRGKFLNCDDHRVSRQHAEIAVKEDTVVLKSLNKNPCYYNKLNVHRTIMLPQGEWVSLSNGDRFGLLPETIWYELILCNADTSMQSAVPKAMEQENGIDVGERAVGTLRIRNITTEVNETENETDLSLLKLEFDEAMEESGNCESQSLICDNVTPRDANTTPPITTTYRQTESDETTTPAKRTHSPEPRPDAKRPKTEPESPKEAATEEANTQRTNDTMSSTDADTKPQDHINMSIEPQDPMDVNKEPLNPINVNTGDDSANDSEPECPMDAHTEPQSPSNDVKKEPLSPEYEKDVKKEPQSPKDEKDVKKEPDVAKPGSSHDQPGSSHANGAPAKPPSGPGRERCMYGATCYRHVPCFLLQGSSHADGAPAKPPSGPGRERCMYGATCYRKNPQHKTQFSHPGDGDYGEGPRGQCPYGAACQRTDPRHWAAHEHPPGVAQPPPRHHDPHNRQGNPAKKRQRRVVRQPSESEDSDQDSPSPSPDLIVHGKRKRKAVKRESWSDSDEEIKDPYATDESDEWEPK